MWSKGAVIIGVAAWGEIGNEKETPQWFPILERPDRGLVEATLSDFLAIHVLMIEEAPVASHADSALLPSEAVSSLRVRPFSAGWRVPDFSHRASLWRLMRSNLLPSSHLVAKRMPS